IGEHKVGVLGCYHSGWKDVGDVELDDEESVEEVATSTDFITAHCEEIACIPRLQTLEYELETKPDGTIQCAEENKEFLITIVRTY
ncbi:hypothetical protein PENTCL1PPCAC_25908, partial [Pristionchus entomophagus]